MSLVQTKRLIIDDSDPNKVTVVRLVQPEETAPEGKLFIVYAAQKYSIVDRESLEEYLNAVLQNHDVQILPEQRDPGHWLSITIDGIAFEANFDFSTPNLHCELTGEKHGIALSTNNFNEYKFVLGFLHRCKNMAHLKRRLAELDIDRGHLYIRDTWEVCPRGWSGLCVDCRSHTYDLLAYKDDYRIFRDDATGKWRLLNVFHYEGETYHSGNEPYTLIYLEAKAASIQKRIDRYKELEAQVDKLNA